MNKLFKIIVPVLFITFVYIALIPIGAQIFEYVYKQIGYGSSPYKPYVTGLTAAYFGLTAWYLSRIVKRESVHRNSLVQIEASILYTLSLLEDTKFEIETHQEAVKENSHFKIYAREIELSIDLIQGLRDIDLVNELFDINVGLMKLQNDINRLEYITDSERERYYNKNIEKDAFFSNLKKLEPHFTGTLSDVNQMMNRLASVKVRIEFTIRGLKKWGFLFGVI